MSKKKINIKEYPRKSGKGRLHRVSDHDKRVSANKTGHPEPNKITYKDLVKDKVRIKRGRLIEQKKRLKIANEELVRLEKMVNLHESYLKESKENYKNKKGNIDSIKRIIKSLNNFIAKYNSLDETAIRAFIKEYLE